MQQVLTDLMPATAATLGLTCQHKALALPPRMAVQTVNGDAPGAPQEALMGALQHRALQVKVWPTGQSRCSTQLARCSMLVPPA